MKDVREQVESNACIVAKIESGEIGWTHDQNER